MTSVKVLKTGRRRILTWLLLQVAVPGLLMAQSSERAMFRADLLRDGNFQAEGPTRHASLKWKFKTGPVVEAWFSSPTVVNRVVYFGADDGYVYAVDVESGKEKWRFKTGDVVYSSPAIAENTVYAGSHDGNMYAINADTGREKWRFQTGYRVYSSPASAPSA